MIHTLKYTCMYVCMFFILALVTPGTADLGVLLGVVRERKRALINFGFVSSSSDGKQIGYTTSTFVSSPERWWGRGKDKVCTIYRLMYKLINLFYLTMVFLFYLIFTQCIFIILAFPELLFSELINWITNTHCIQQPITIWHNVDVAH